MGPSRLSPDEVRTIFGGAFEVQSITRSEFQGAAEPRPKALFCVLVRR